MLDGVQEGRQYSSGAEFPQYQRSSQVTGGGLGNLIILDNTEGPTCFSSINVGFVSLEIHEDDRHLTVFCNANSKLWEYVRRGFGLKTVPSPFANYMGERPMSVNPRSVKNWVDTTGIAIPSMSIAAY